MSFVKFVVVGLALLGPAFSLSAYADSQNLGGVTLFRIGTGGHSGTYYPIGGMIAHTISNPPGSRTCEDGGSCGVPGLVAVAQASHGAVDNIKGVSSGFFESGFAQSDVTYWAYTGTGTFQGDRPAKNLRAIASLYTESIHLVARKGAGIKSVSDLKGKRVSLDEPGSGTLVDARLILEAFGVSEKDLKVRHVKHDVAAQQINNNNLDAFFIVAGYPVKSVAELAFDNGAEFVPIQGEPVQKLIDKYGFFVKDVIPANVYKDIDETQTISVDAQWIVRANVDEELVYGITKALWNETSFRLLQNGHRKGEAITRKTALDGIGIPLHDGAKRYYKEVGLLK